MIYRHELETSLHSFPNSHKHNIHIENRCAQNEQKAHLSHPSLEIACHDEF